MPPSVIIAEKTIFLWCLSCREFHYQQQNWLMFNDCVELTKVRKTLVTWELPQLDVVYFEHCWSLVHRKYVRSLIRSVIWSVKTWSWKVVKLSWCDRVLKKRMALFHGLSETCACPWASVSGQSKNRSSKQLYLQYFFFKFTRSSSWQSMEALSYCEKWPKADTPSLLSVSFKPGYRNRTWKILRYVELWNKVETLRILAKTM